MVGVEVFASIGASTTGAVGTVASTEMLTGPAGVSLPAVSVAVTVIVCVPSINATVGVIL